MLKVYRDNAPSALKLTRRRF